MVTAPGDDCIPVLMTDAASRSQGRSTFIGMRRTIPMEILRARGVALISSARICSVRASLAHNCFNSLELVRLANMAIQKDI